MSEEFLRVREWAALYENNRTRDYKKLNWVPIPNRMDGDGYTELVDHPNGAAHLGAWVAIVQVASRCEPRGVLARAAGRPHDAASLARITRLPVEVFTEVLPRLLSIGWLEVIPQDAAEIPQDTAGLSQSTYAERNGTERNGTEQNYRIEGEDALLLTPENIQEAKQAIGAHRGRGDEPDTTIVRKILGLFQDADQFRKWAAGLAAGLDPKEIKGEGYGLYLSDSRRWIDNGCRRPRKRTVTRTTVSPYFDPSTITGKPSTPVSTPIDRYTRFHG